MPASRLKPIVRATRAGISASSGGGPTLSRALEEELFRGAEVLSEGSCRGKGDRGDTGSPGPSGCDGLLCPGTDLEAGQRATLTVDGGFEVATVAAYRTSCAAPSTRLEPGTCTVRVGGADSAATKLDAWFAIAMSGNVGLARRSFTLTVFDSTGEPIRRFYVESGIPSEMTHQNDRFQFVVKADAILRVSPS